MSGKVSDNTGTGSGVIAAVVSSTESSSDPTRSTNPASGVGTEWHNTTTGEILICIDATSGANKWKGQKDSHIGTGQRGLFMGGGGNEQTGASMIDYITIDTLGNGTAFGNLVKGRWSQPGAGSNGLLGRYVCAGGNTTASWETPANIDYGSISTLGDAADFGQLSTHKWGQMATMSNGTDDKVIWAGGHINPGSYGGGNTMKYVNPSSTGNASSFGSLGIAFDSGDNCGLSNGKNDRGVQAGGAGAGGSWPGINQMQYINMADTSGSAGSTDFGDLAQSSIYGPGGCSNDTQERGVWWGRYFYSGGALRGNTIQYITINSASNATDFGDMLSNTGGGAATSNGTGQRGVHYLLGYLSSGNTKTGTNGLEYITINSTGNATNFGDLRSNDSRYNGTATSDGQG